MIVKLDERVPLSTLQSLFGTLSFDHGIYTKVTTNITQEIDVVERL